MDEYGLEEGDVVEVNHFPRDGRDVFGTTISWAVEMKVYAKNDTHVFLALTTEELEVLEKEQVRHFDNLCVPRDEPDRHPEIDTIEVLRHG